MTLKERLRQTAQKNGAKYFGVSPAARLDNMPDGHRPGQLLPGAKSVIVMGMRVPDSAIRASDRAFEGLRHAIFSYIAFGDNIIDERLDWAAMECIVQLENLTGGAALGIPAGRPKNVEKQMQLMSNRSAAVCAGLGEMGFSGFVLTPNDGARVRFVSVITDVELEPDELYSGPKLCRYPECTACVDICPAGALSTEKLVDFCIGDMKTQYAHRDKPRCRAALDGLIKGTPGRLQADMPEQMDTIEDWYKLYRRNDPWQRMEQNHGNFCRRCMTVCPVGQQGKGEL